MKFTFFGMLSLTKKKQTPKRNSVKVDTTLIEKENQIVNPDKIGIFNDYFSTFKIGTHHSQEAGLTPVAQTLMMAALCIVKKLGHSILSRRKCNLSS